MKVFIAQIVSVNKRLAPLINASLLPPECSIYQRQGGEGSERHFVSSWSVKRSSVVQARGREELANITFSDSGPQMCTYERERARVNASAVPV